MMLAVFKESPVTRFFFFGYLFVCAWLGLGLFIASSSAGLFVLAVHMAVFVVATPLLCKALNLEGVIDHAMGGYPSSKTLGKFLSLALLGIATIHWSVIGNIPFLLAAFTPDAFEAARIRQSASETPLVINYGYSIFSGGILPTICLFLFVIRDRFASVFFCFAIAYIASFLQKAPPIFLAIPIILYCLYSRQYRILIRTLTIAAMIFFGVHFALNGYFVRSLGFISTAQAATDPSQTETSKYWTAIKFVNGRGWLDAYEEFRSGRWLIKKSIRFDGTRSLYKPVPEKFSIGSNNFSVKLVLKFDPDFACDSYGTVAYLGPEKGWEGVFQVLLRCNADIKPFLDFTLMSANGKTGFGYYSTPLDTDIDNIIEFYRSGYDIEIKVNEATSKYNTEIFDLSPPVGTRKFFNLGSQFGGGFRSMGEGLLTGVSLANFIIDVPALPDAAKLTNLDSLLLDRDLIERSSVIGNSAFLLVSGNIGNLLDRLLFAPGRVGAIWVDLIPREFPFVDGCGYRPLALLMGCDFINFPVVIHKRVEPSLWEDGIRGTLNAAEVFNGYANFGLLGAALTGFFMAIMAVFLGYVYRGHRVVGYSLISPFLVMQSSIGLPVALLSGGWLASILVFLFIRRYLNSDFSLGR